MKDIQSITGILEDEDMWVNIINDLSRRRPVEGKDSINFYEWLFLRAVAVAWDIASG